MKSLFGFLLLIATALLLLTVITGVGGIFSSIAQTWTTEQTAEIASGLSQILWLGGIVFVMVLGYGLFVNMSKGSRGWGNSRQAPPLEPPYQIIDGQYSYNQPTRLLSQTPDDTQWYDFDNENAATPTHRL